MWFLREKDAFKETYAELHITAGGCWILSEKRLEFLKHMYERSLKSIHYIQILLANDVLNILIQFYKQNLRLLFTKIKLAQFLKKAEKRSKT